MSVKVSWKDNPL